MAKTSFVLRALSILGLEEILKLSEVVAERIPLKKAAGEDLLAWNDPPKRKSIHEVAPEEDAQGKVLEFPKRKSIHEFEELEDPNRPKPSDEEGEEANLIGADMLLWQREISQETGKAMKKVDAFKGYQKSTQMYVVKTESPEGKQKIRFASTDGILVNKKQN